LKIEKKNQNFEKMAFRVVHWCSRVCGIHSQTHIFKVGHLQNVFIEHDLYLIS